MVLVSGLDLLWLHVLLELPALLQLLGLPGLVLVHKFWAPGRCQWFLMRCFLLSHEFQVEPVLLALLWGSDQGLQADWLLVSHCLSPC